MFPICSSPLTLSGVLRAVSRQALQIQTEMGPLEGCRTCREALLQLPRSLVHPRTGQGPSLRVWSEGWGVALGGRRADARNGLTHRSCMTGSASRLQSNSRPWATLMVSSCNSKFRARAVLLIDIARKGSGGPRQKPAKMKNRPVTFPP